MAPWKPASPFEAFATRWAISRVARADRSSPPLSSPTIDVAPKILDSIRSSSLG
jgi:hypothetical protein